MLTKKVQGWLGSPGAPAPQIALAAFGKHPGWDDHIEDLGLETETLILARRVLYSEGVGGNIESGAWDKLEDHQRLPGFGHIVVWRRGAELVIARIWSSSDGKGRTRYPMVLCAHSAGVPLSWAIHEVLPRLEKAQTRCEETPKAADVREIVQATRLKLRTALKGSMAELNSWTGDDVAQDRELARLAESPQLQAFRSEPNSPPPPPRAGLLRILYQVEREMGAFAAGSAKERRSGMPSARAQQIRVPACGVPAGDAGRLWTGVLLETLADGVGIMTIQSVDQRWLDIIVGEPGTTNLFCMRASDKMIPLTSDVPYTLDADFIARAQVMIDAWSGLAPPKPKTGPAPAVPATPASAAAPTSAPAPTPAVAIGAPQRAMPVWMVVVVGLVVVLAAVITVMALRGTAEPEPIDGPVVSEPPEQAPEPQVPPRPVTESGPGPAAPETPAPPSGAPGTIPPPPTAPSDPGRAESTSPPPPPPVAQTTEPSVAPTAPAALPAPRGEPEPARPEPKARPETPIAVPASAVERAVAVGVGLEEQVTPGGPTLEEAAERVTRGGGGSASLTASVQKLKEIKGLEDRAALEKVIREATSRTAFEAFAAWRRLVELGWPAATEELKAVPAARQRVLALAEGVGDGVRRPALRREFTASARKAVIAGLEVCGAESDVQWQEMLAVADAAGVSRAELGPVARYNTLLLEFRLEVASVISGREPSPERGGDAAARVRAFLAQLEGLEAGTRVRVEALVVALARLLEEVTGPVPQAPARPDFASMGPGAAGWRLLAGSTPALLIYEMDRPGAAGGRGGEGGAGAPAAPDRLEFAPVPGTGVYLSRDEVPVGLALRAIGRKGLWGEVRKARLLRMFEPAENDPRLGPRTWDWSVRRPGEAEVAAQWIWPGPAEARVKVKSEAPPETTPVQHLSVDAMVCIAGLVGCRLPTLEEWRRALASEQAVSGTLAEKANLRDTAWKRQWELVARAKEGLGSPPWPDRGAFRPPELLLVQERAVAATEADDGAVWFTPVGVGPGRVFRNLVGNVAEVVLTDAARVEGVERLPPEQIKDRLGDRSMIRVVGGSAISAAEVGTDRAWPVEVTPSREGWADVGFRLAMPAPAGVGEPGPAAGEGVWAGAARAAAEAEYLGRE